jgi:hypothetical protein
MFETILLVPFLSLAGIIPVLEEYTEKGKAKLETHAKGLLLLVLFGFVIGLLVQMENMIVPTTATTSLTLPGLESFYILTVPIAALISYVMAALLAKAYFALKEKV